MVHNLQKVMGMWKVKEEAQYSLTETHCRGITMYADFLTGAPDIHQLSCLDKVLYFSPPL